MKTGTEVYKTGSLFLRSLQSWKRGVNKHRNGDLTYEVAHDEYQNAWHSDSIELGRKL